MSRAFVPQPLPPEPPIEVSGALQRALDEALLALGRLDSMTSKLPDTTQFLLMYVRKEAVLSSQIEGTQSSLSDLLLFETNRAQSVPLDDVREVSCYVDAMQHAMARMAELPLSNRLIRDVHRVLLSQGRGADKQPGEFRSAQVWIGDPRTDDAFVPPPPDRVADCMKDFERFLHEPPERVPILTRVALAHVQFETIHPFLDGNGRVGRLLIPLLLRDAGVLREPLLYLSLYFKTHRARYYELLQRVRLKGDWEAWLRFFADGVRETAEGAAETARRIDAVFQEDQGTIARLPRSASTMRVLHVLKQNPMQMIPHLARETGLTRPTVAAAIRKLEGLDIVDEVTGKKRDRIFSYRRYLEILSEGTWL